MKDFYNDLNNILDNITEESMDTDIPKLSSLMCSEKSKKEIAKLISKDHRKLDDKVGELASLVKAARIIYEYSGFDTGMSDSEFDILYHKLEKLVGVINVTPTISGNKEKVHHRFPSLRGTLDKVYALTADEKVNNKSQVTLDDWIKTTENKLKDVSGQYISLENIEVILFPKFDGVSCVFEFNEDGSLERALTRGYTETNLAKDITHIFQHKVVGPYKKADYPYAVKTELMMTNEDFEACNEYHGTNYKQSRSMVSSIINSDKPDSRAKYIKIIPLRWSQLINGHETKQELSPAVYDTPFKLCKMRERNVMREFAESVRTVNGLRTDGVVIYINDAAIREILGRENDRQKYEVAYKFTEEIGYTEVVDAHFSIGLFGTFTPIIDVKPIKLKGNTVSAASIGNYGRFKKLRLAKGDVVKIIYDIVPYLEFDPKDPKCKRNGNYPINAPRTCDECGMYLEEIERDTGIIDLVCTNEDCPAKEKGRVLNYLTKLGIDSIGPTTIDILYSSGFLRSIKDLYNLEHHVKAISKIKGIGPKTIDYIITMIDNKRDAYASDFMTAMGIRGVSKAKFKEVFSHMGFDDFIECCLNDKEVAISTFTNMKGIGEKTALKIIKGVRRNQDLIEFLENELVIHDNPRSASPNFKVCFTKIRSKELEDFIINNKGIVTDNVTKDCALLVVPMHGIRSNKVKMAMLYNVPIIDFTNAKKFIKENLI